MVRTSHSHVYSVEAMQNLPCIVLVLKPYGEPAQGDGFLGQTSDRRCKQRLGSDS